MDKLVKVDELNNLGIKYVNDGKLKEAIEYFKKAQKLNPFSPYTHYFLGLTYQQLNDNEKAFSCYKKAIELKPDYDKANNNLGLLYLGKNNYPEAEKHFKKALLSNPSYILALINLGETYQLLHKLDEAITCYQKALSIKPDFPEAYNNLGVILFNMNRHQEAEKVLKKAIKLKKDYAETYFHLGEVEEDLLKLQDAFDYFEKSLSIDPSFAYTLNTYMGVLMKINKWDRLKEISEQIGKLTIKELKQNVKTTESPFLNLIRQPDPQINYSTAKSFSDSITKSVGNFHRFTYKKKKQKKKIRIGYLSFDLNDHVISHQIFGLFRLHDRNTFEVYTYSYGLDDKSCFRKEIQQHSDVFTDLSNMGNIEAAETIHKDNIDILIDLGGHTKGNRLQICALKPAPVQVAYLGFPGTSGADFFDYIITDKGITPPESAQYYSEKFAYLPYYQISSYPYLQPLLKRTKKDYGLPEKSFVYCSFNNSFKIQKEVFLTWTTCLSCPLQKRV